MSAELRCKDERPEGSSDGEEDGLESVTPPQSVERPPFGSEAGSADAESSAAGGAAAGGEGGAPFGADPEMTQLQVVMRRCEMLEAQNSALWQELNVESGGSESDSPTAKGGAPEEGAGPTPLVSIPGAEPVPDDEPRTVEELEKLLAYSNDELKFLRDRCMQFELEVEAEFEELSGQLFEARQQVHAQQAVLNESEANRKQMEGSKQMLEAKLQDAGLQLMECERQLAEAMSAPAPEQPCAVSESPGTEAGRAPLPAGHHLHSILEEQIEQLKEENKALMEELVSKKMALAELSETHARLKRDLHRQSKRDKAVNMKMMRIHAIMSGSPAGVRQERGHLLGSSPTSATLARRQSLEYSPRPLRRMSGAGGENMPRASSPADSMMTTPSRPVSGASGGTPFTGDRDFVRPWR